jgi:hypothetical protein
VCVCVVEAEAEEREAVLGYSGEDERRERRDDSTSPSHPSACSLARVGLLWVKR